eukprot:gene9649-17411_t
MATQSSEISLSSYVQSMGASAKTRYLSKIECIEEDPYLLKKPALGENMKHLPNVDYTDIVNYLVYSTNYLTEKEIKAKKSLQAYKNFLSGWVLEAATKLYKDKCVLIGTSFAACK